MVTFLSSFFFSFWRRVVDQEWTEIRRISCRFMVSNTVVNFIIGLKRFVEGWEGIWKVGVLSLRVDLEPVEYFIFWFELDLSFLSHSLF